MKKRLKGLISVFFFLLCIFAWKSVQEVRAAENVIRDFSRIFYIPAGAVLKGGSLQKLQEIYDGMSCIAYTEDGEEIYLDAIWDYSGIDIQTVGAYKITGTVRLPEGYTSNVGLPEWTAWISVQNPGQPEIQVYSRMISARYDGNMASKRRRGLGKCKRGRIWICGYRWDVSFLPEYDS